MTTAGQPLTYRLLTGPDDITFCARVSQALAEGYQLHGSPALIFDGQRIIAAQAVVLPDAMTAEHPARNALGSAVAQKDQQDSTADASVLDSHNPLA